MDMVVGVSCQDEKIITSVIIFFGKRSDLFRILQKLSAEDLLRIKHESLD